MWVKMISEYLTQNHLNSSIKTQSWALCLSQFWMGSWKPFSR